VSRIEVTCSCGRTLNVRSEYAGKKGRCKGCGATIQIPDTAAAGPSPSDAPPSSDEWDAMFLQGYDDEDSAAAAAAAVAAAIQVGELDEDDERHAPLIRRGTSAVSEKALVASIPPEPWYYAFLVTFAGLTLRIGLLACAATLVIGLLGTVLASNDTSSRWFTAGLSLMGLGILGVVPTLLASAPILLAVDAARNLRAMRYGIR
jgi:hypothetical protein